MNQQGSPRGSDDHGQEMLDNWGLDLYGCRAELNDVEVERIILDAPTLLRSLREGSLRKNLAARNRYQFSIGDAHCYRLLTGPMIAGPCSARLAPDRLLTGPMFTRPAAGRLQCTCRAMAHNGIMGPCTSCMRAARLPARARVTAVFYRRPPRCGRVWCVYCMLLGPRFCRGRCELRARGRSTATPKKPV